MYQTFQALNRLALSEYIDTVKEKLRNSISVNTEHQSVEASVTDLFAQLIQRVSNHVTSPIAKAVCYVKFFQNVVADIDYKAADEVIEEIRPIVLSLIRARVNYPLETLVEMMIIDISFIQSFVPDGQLQVNSKFICISHLHVILKEISQFEVTNRNSMFVNNFLAQGVHEDQL